MSVEVSDQFLPRTSRCRRTPRQLSDFIKRIYIYYTRVQIIIIRYFTSVHYLHKSRSAGTPTKHIGIILINCNEKEGKKEKKKNVKKN